MIPQGTFGKGSRFAVFRISLNLFIPNLVIILHKPVAKYTEFVPI